MPFYVVRVHGVCTPLVASESPLPFRGFYTTRWVFAPDEQAAGEKAFTSARTELQKWSAIRDGLVSLKMETNAIWRTGPWRLLFRGAGRGFSFYERD
jgi:hypothetical protein